MVSKKEPEQKQGGMKRILAAIAIIATALFLLAAAAPAAAPESSVQPTATVSNYTPTPVMNTNVTWSTFNSTWAPLEYFNGTAYENLTAQESSTVKNPISIKTGNIKPYTLNGKYADENFFNGSLYQTFYAVDNYKIGNTSQGLYVQENATSTYSLFDSIVVKVPWAQMPSQNPNYDYISGSISLSSTSGTTASAGINIANITASGNYGTHATPIHINSGESVFQSMTVEQMIAGTGIKTTSTQSPYIYIGVYLSQAAGPPADTPIMNLTLSNFAITTYPISLGDNSTGSPVTQAINTANLSSFHPTVPMLIQNNGYTVSVQQTIQNATEQQTSINAGSYTEQATYQGIFEMPTAPDLSYSASNITVPLTISGAQYEVANLNGVSYLSSIQTKTNGTFSFGTVNPNSQNSLVLEVEYTTAQWDASSSAPSFFTLAGIEYYWWVTVLGLMGLIGLGSIALSHFGGEEETLRIPKGKYGR